MSISTPPKARLLPRSLVEVAARAPLYRRRLGQATSRRLEAWPLVDMEALLAQGDPFGGRLPEGATPPVVVQVGEGLPLYWGLVGGDLEAMADVLAFCWRRLGLRRGDRVAIYDYGTSALVMFASRAYTPHLRSGAAERLGCTPICNDGLPEMAPRALHLLTYVRPRLLFLGEEGAEALLHHLQARGATLAGLVERVVLAPDERPLSPQEVGRWQEALGVPVAQLLRADICMLLAPPCPCGLGFHLPPPYVVEVGPEGRLTVTHRRLLGCPVVRHVTDIKVGRLEEGRCPCGHVGATVCL